MWDNIADCEAQLHGTIVRYGDIPVMVDQITGDNEDILVVARGIASGDQHTLKLGDLELSPVPLGYINNGGTAVYLTRMPRRRWKHGLDASAIHALGHRGGGNRFSFTGDALPYLANTISNVYPSLQESRRAVDSGTASTCAFCRLFAVSRRYVYYKGQRIGTWAEGGLVLSDTYQYLKELWEEEVNANRT